MIYLLDTHYILWVLFEPDKIQANIRTILENEADTKLISDINLWEISLKYSLGKLDLGGVTPEDVYASLLESGFRLAELDSEIFITSYKLPKKADHKDPFDRLLIWQTISNGYTLLTQDQKIEQYAEDGLNVVVGNGS